MADKFYEVTITITKLVTVRVPVDDPEVVYPNDKPEDVAIEFAEEHRTYSEYVVYSDEDRESEVREISPQITRAA